MSAGTPEPPTATLVRLKLHAPSRDACCTAPEAPDLLHREVLPAVMGSGVALLFLSRESINRWGLQLSGLVMALGIGCMH